MLVGNCALAAGGPQRLAPIYRREDLSNPSLVVVDNQPATLEVGDQVPITTGSATVLSANNAVVNTVDYKNTGIILSVLPRVNSNGTVLLDIEQEISAVVNNLASGSASTYDTNLTPTISERKVKSELSVAKRTDGALGRIDQRNSERRPFWHPRSRPNSVVRQRFLVE